MLIRWIWRFFTGAHMDGKLRKHRDGPVKPMFANIYWNRIPRWKRALWRNTLFFGSGFLVFGILVNQSLTVYCFLAMIPFVIARFVKLAFNKFTTVVKSTSGDGITTEYRMIRPKYAKRLRRLKPRPFRLHLPGPEGVTRNATVEEARTVLAVNAEEKGEPILSLQLMQGENDVTDAPLSGRARNIRRKATRGKRAS